jgi:histidinol dehydrogenase
VLPTAGTARFASVLGLEDFQRRLHVVEVHDEALSRLGWAVEALATAEGLLAHADSIALRRELGW